jgi:hypothetical protein
MSEPKTSAYYEKLELVFKEYERCYDLDVALDIVPMSQEQRDVMLSDTELHARIRVALAKKQAAIFEGLDDLATSSESDGVKLSALRDLGALLHPKRFKGAAGAASLPGRFIVRFEEVAADA